jgi:hypothetical protein
MKSIRRIALVLLFIGWLGVWQFLYGLEQSYREEGQNYSHIEEGLYQGGDVDAPPQGTQAVLNLCRQPDQYRSKIYRWEPIRDAAPAPSLAWLRRMVDFIDARLRAGATTYVHCRNGVSRSGLVVTAYEMFHHGWTRDRALAFVRSKPL